MFKGTVTFQNPPKIKVFGKQYTIYVNTLDQFIQTNPERTKLFGQDFKYRNNILQGNNQCIQYIKQ